MTDDRTQEIVQQIRTLAASDISDPETAHAEADRLLCELVEIAGYAEAAEAFRRIDKWYA